MDKKATLNLINEFTDKIDCITSNYKRSVLTSTECFEEILYTHLDYERLIITSCKYVTNRVSLIVAINGITSSVIRTI